MTYILYSCVYLHNLEKNWRTVKNPKFIITYSEHEYESANRAKYPVRHSVRKWTLHWVRILIYTSN